MGLGIKALNYSANVAFGEGESQAESDAVVALRPAVIEGEGDFAGLTGAVPGLFPVPTQATPKDEMGKSTFAAAGSIAFALLFNVLLFVAAPLLLTNALFIAAGWTSTPAVERTVTPPTNSAASASATESNQNQNS